MGQLRELRLWEKTLRIKLGELRRIIRKALIEGPAGPGVSADPKDVKGFYPYELERGTDIQSFWYKSPGREMGSDGDPGRPEDANEYIGMKAPDTKPLAEPEKSES